MDRHGFAGKAAGKMLDLSYADFYRANWLYCVRHVLYRYPQLGWHDAEDVAQDALLRAWEQWNQYDSARATRTTWLLTIALWYGRTAYNRYARKTDLEASDDMEPDPYEGLARRELLEQASQRIEKVGGSTLTGLYTALFDGATVREAALSQDVSYVAATGRLQHIRAILRRDIDATPLEV